MGMRMVDPGNIVHASDQGAIAILTQTEPTAVMFTLPAQTLDDVREAMARGAVEVAAYDRDNARLLSTGTLRPIDNLIDQTTATYRLKAMFANDDEKLWPGEFVNARLLLETRKDVVVIPPLAVQRGPHGLFTWVVKPDNTVEPRPIQIGATTGDRTIVTSGVNDGDRVVTDGQYKLQTNAPVTITAPHGTADARGRDVNISEPFIRRPVATTLLMAALAFVGIVVVPVPAGRAAAAGRLPDHPGHDDLGRRQRRDHGDLGRRAARAAVRPDRRHHPDDVAELARRHHHRHPVRSQPQHRFRRPGRAGGDHGRQQDLAAGADDAADLQEGQSGGRRRSCCCRCIPTPCR